MEMYIKQTENQWLPMLFASLNKKQLYLLYNMLVTTFPEEAFNTFESNGCAYIIGQFGKSFEGGIELVKTNKMLDILCATKSQSHFRPVIEITRENI